MFEEPGGSSGHSLVAGSIHETRAGDVLLALYQHLSSQLVS